MVAFQVYCERLAGQSLTARDALVEFDAEGVSGPLSEEVAGYLLGIPGFEARGCVEVEDVEPEPEEEAAATEAAGVLPLEEERVTEESAFLRWYYAHDAEQRARFIETENLKRAELLRVMEEETKSGNHPKVFAAIARMLFKLRRLFTRQQEEEPAE